MEKNLCAPLHQCRLSFSNGASQWSQGFFNQTKTTKYYVGVVYSVNILWKHRQASLQYCCNIDIKVFIVKHCDIWFCPYGPALTQSVFIHLNYTSTTITTKIFYIWILSSQLMRFVSELTLKDSTNVLLSNTLTPITKGKFKKWLDMTLNAAECVCSKYPLQFPYRLYV